MICLKLAEHLLLCHTLIHTAIEIVLQGHKEVSSA